MNRLIIEADLITLAMIGQCLWGTMLAHTMRMALHLSGSSMYE